MKDLTVYKGRKRNGLYLVFSLIFSFYIVYLFINDNTHYPNGRGFYWPITIICIVLTIFFGYEYFDRRPLFIFKKDGIYFTRNKTLKWGEISSYAIEESHNHIYTATLVLYTNDDELIKKIMISQTNVSITQIENIVSRHLSKKV